LEWKSNGLTVSSTAVHKSIISLNTTEIRSENHITRSALLRSNQILCAPLYAEQACILISSVTETEC